MRETSTRYHPLGGAAAVWQLLHFLKGKGALVNIHFPDYGGVEDKVREYTNRCFQYAVMSMRKS